MTSLERSSADVPTASPADEYLTPGMRVERPVDVYAAHSPVLVGTVLRRYSEPGYDELYEVRWDTRAGKPIEPTTRQGYFRHGIALSWKQRADV